MPSADESGIGRYYYYEVDPKFCLKSANFIAAALSATSVLGYSRKNPSVHLEQSENQKKLMPQPIKFYKIGHASTSCQHFSLLSSKSTLGDSRLNYLRELANLLRNVTHIEHCVGR